MHADPSTPVSLFGVIVREVDDPRQRLLILTWHIIRLCYRLGFCRVTVICDDSACVIPHQPPHHDLRHAVGPGVSRTRMSDRPYHPPYASNERFGTLDLGVANILIFITTPQRIAFHDLNCECLPDGR